MSNNLIEFDLGFVDAVVIGGGADDDGSYDEGYEVGKAEGLEEGKNIGYADGFSKGEEAGFDKGYADGKEDGFTEGEDIGYNKGYDEGEAYGKQNAPTEDLGVTITSNGTYIYSKPQDKYYDEVEVVVNVPSEKTPTQEKSVTITKNGTEVVVPDTGYALEKVTVTTNIDTRLPEQEKSLEVTENKVYEVTPDSGYALKKVTVTGNVASSGGGDDDGQLIKITTATSFDGIYYPALENLIVGMDWTNFNKQKKESLASLFSYYQGKNIYVANLDTSYATSMKSMFENCDGAFFDGDLTHFQTGNVTNMNSMFANTKITQLNLSGWDVSKVTDMTNMFRYSPLTSINMSGWNTSSVTKLNSMFYYCSGLRTLDLSSFDTSKVAYMDSMFYQCSLLESLDLSSFNTSKVLGNPYQLFYRCEKLTNVVWGSNWASNKDWNTIDAYESPLSKASILDLANKIADKSDTKVYTGTQQVRLKKTQQSLFTEDELTALANQFNAKNWTLTWY